MGQCSLLPQTKIYKTYTYASQAKIRISVKIRMIILLGWFGHFAIYLQRFYAAVYYISQLVIKHDE